MRKGVVLVLMMMLCGCNADGLHPVAGQLMVNGKPLAGAGIVLSPLDDRGWPAVAETGEDGTFRIRTQSMGDGARAGEYAVTIVWEEPVHPYLQLRDGAPGKAEMEKEYREWRAKHKPAPSPVPAEYAAAATTPLKITVPLAKSGWIIEIPPTKTP